MKALFILAALLSLGVASAAKAQVAPENRPSTTANRDGGHGDLAGVARQGGDTSYLGRSASEGQPPTVAPPANEGAPITNSSAR